MEALGKTACDLVESVRDLVVNLNTGSGPKKEEVDESDQFFKLVCKKLENFCVKTVRMNAAAPQDGKLNFGVVKTKRLVGGPAIQASFTELQDEFDKNAAGMKPDQFKEVKKYKWTLDDEQLTKFQNMLAWVTDMVPISSALCDEAKPSGAATSCGEGSAPSSGSLVAFKPQTKASTKNDVLMEAKCAKMARFYLPPLPLL